MKVLQMAAAFALALISAHTAAESSPKALPVTLVVPYAPGGPTDIMARALADALSTSLQHKVAVRNIGGAGSTIGFAHVSKAKPDGRTLLIANTGLATAVSLYPNLRHHPATDLQPIGLVADVPMTLVASNKLGVGDLKAVLDLVRRGGRTLSIGHAGIGSASYLCSLMLMHATGLDFISVPYQGTAPALREVSAGHVDLLCDQTSHTLPHVRAGRVKPLGVGTRKRLDALPQVPTVAEAGLPGFELTIWHGLFAPKGTPASSVATLERALAKALADPRLATSIRHFEANAADAARAQPDALADRLAKDIVRWRPVIERTAVRATP